MAGRCSSFCEVDWLDGVKQIDWPDLERYATQNLHILCQGIPDSPRSKQRVAVSDTARRFAAKLGAAVPSSWWAVQDTLNGVIELSNIKSISGGYNEKSGHMASNIGSIWMNMWQAFAFKHVRFLFNSYHYGFAWLHMVIWLSGRLHGRTA